MKSLRLLVVGTLLVALSGCISFGRGKDCNDKIAGRGDASTKNELAELLKLHRLCLQKYEDNVTKLKENCAVYREAIHDLVPPNQKASVVDILERLLLEKKF